MSAKAATITVVLVLILVLEAGLVQRLYRDRAATTATVLESKASLDREQRQLATLQQEVVALQGQIDQVQKQREAGEKAFLEITAGYIKWHEPLSALFGAQGTDVRFESVTAKPEGEVVLKGVATDVGTMARLQAQLKDISHLIDLQSLGWEATSASLKFTAAVKVRR